MASIEQLPILLVADESQELPVPLKVRGRPGPRGAVMTGQAAEKPMGGADCFCRNHGYTTGCGVCVRVLTLATTERAREDGS